MRIVHRNCVCTWETNIVSLFDALKQMFQVLCEFLNDMSDCDSSENSNLVCFCVQRVWEKNCVGAGRSNRYECRRCFSIYLRYCVGGHFMSIWIQVLYLTVVGPLVRNVKRRWDWTSVGINASMFKQILIELLVQVIDRVVECQQNNLRYLLNRHVNFAIVHDDEWE